MKYSIINIIIFFKWRKSTNLFMIYLPKMSTSKPLHLCMELGCICIIYILVFLLCYIVEHSDKFEKGRNIGGFLKKKVEKQQEIISTFYGKNILNTGYPLHSFILNKFAYGISKSI
jgi:hypothetical protein